MFSLCKGRDGAELSRGRLGIHPSFNRARHTRLGMIGVLLASSVVLALASGCAPEAPYVWVQDVTTTPKPPNQLYVILPGDVLAVRVYSDEKLSTQVRVRPDGYITLMLLGDVMAAGKTPLELAKTLQEGLSKFLNSPTLAVVLEEQQDIRVTVLGEVGAPGLVPLPKDAGLLQAIAAAGGLNPFADDERIFVLRQNPRIRIRFAYDDLLANDQQAVSFTLLPGDVITVE